MSDGPTLQQLGYGGGIFAGLVALLSVLGKGARWLLVWDERRKQTFHAKLTAWEARLVAREAKIEAEEALRWQLMEERTGRLERAYALVVHELRAMDPGNVKLAEADQIMATPLREAFPVDRDTPADMRAALDRMN